MLTTYETGRCCVSSDCIMHYSLHSVELLITPLVDVHPPSFDPTLDLVDLSKCHMVLFLFCLVLLTVYRGGVQDGFHTYLI